MSVQSAFIMLLFFVWSSVSFGTDKPEERWQDVYTKYNDKLPVDFVLNELSYFAGWLQHQGGTVENTILAGKQYHDWIKWGWKIVKTVNFTARLPRGPPAEGPWNDVVIIDRCTHKERRRAKNCVAFQCSDSQPHGNRSCSLNDIFIAPAYCGFARPGNATGRPVFVNYAKAHELAVFTNPNDFCSSDIIIIARHGYTSYGEKVRQIVKHCAHLKSSGLPGGMLIYRDPTGIPPDVKTFPKGIGIPSETLAFRVASIAQMSGDTETRGLPSIDGVYRVDRVEDVALTPFPVQTINYNDAELIINGVGGKPIPKDWEPSKFTHIGPEGDDLIRIAIRNEIDTKPSTLVDAIGIIPGTGPEAAKYVMLGNHRDAWVQGASDPHSGTVILQGVAYLLGLAYQNGWRPKRSIVIASWDAEEVGLIGSTEFTELHRDELRSQAVVYFNQDAPVKGNGSFVLRTDEFLEKALLESEQDVLKPCNLSNCLWQKWHKGAAGNASTKSKTVPVGGSTDHVPFQYHLGIPSAYPEFRPAPPLFEAPAYHTEYDSIVMARKFTDPPCSHADGNLLPIHHFFIRYFFHLILKFSSDYRLPLFLLPKAHTLTQSWSGIVEYAKKTQSDTLKRFEISLDFVSKRICDFLNASKTFEDFYAKMQNRTTKCNHIYNDILGRVSKQFIIHRRNLTPRHILVDSSYSSTHVDSYFPKVRTLIQKLGKCDGETDVTVKALKIELSELVTAFTAASSLLRGGLFDSLEILNEHLCPC